jgi:hypothetical protein
MLLAMEASCLSRAIGEAEHGVSPLLLGWIQEGKAFCPDTRIPVSITSKLALSP